MCTSRDTELLERLTLTLSAFYFGTVIAQGIRF